MNKFCLVLVTLLTVGSVKSQPAYSYIKEYPNRNLEIPHLAAVSVDEVEGNNYYADAEREEEEGDLNGAITLFGKAAFEYNAAQLKSRYANTLMRMSNLHMLLKNYKAAEDVILNVVLKMYTKMGSTEGEMNSYRQLGKIYLNANKLTESLWFFSQQGLLAQRIANKTAYIESVIDIARVKIKKKDFALATKDINRAEVLAKASKITRFSKDIAEARKAISKK